LNVNKLNLENENLAKYIVNNVKDDENKAIENDDLKIEKDIF
jgi:hypothetical protein